MKIKEGCTASTDDFFYDLFDGGYLDPSEILEFEDDIDMIQESIQTIQDFRRACEDNIEGFYR